MIGRAVAAFLVGALAPGAGGAAAQPFPPDEALDVTQKLGRSLFIQSCVVCHVHTQITRGGHFGPDLSGKSLGGQEDVMVEVISNGTPNMPGFKYHFEPAQIRAIAAYVKSLPEPPPANPPR